MSTQLLAYTPTPAPALVYTVTPTTPRPFARAFRVGGLTFVQVGPVSVSFCLTRRPYAPPRLPSVNWGLWLALVACSAFWTGAAAIAGVI